MDKAELKDKIGEQIERNLYYMSKVVTSDNVRKEFEKNIHLLHEVSIKMDAIAVALAPNEDDYNRGLNDAWELAQRIGGYHDTQAYNPDELEDIFGQYMDVWDVFGTYSYSEVAAIVQEYEKKKAEEAKLTPGDVVEVKNMSYGESKAIFVKYEDGDAVVLFRKGGSTRLVGKDAWDIVKTGKHVDISELVEVLYD